MTERIVPLVLAPKEDGASVAVPPLSDVGSLLAVNADRFEFVCEPFLGRSWQDLRAESLREAISAAQSYHRSLGEPIPEPRSGPVIMAGHQPELFHPGVWVKNFALAGLGITHGATTLNLIVDNDTLKSAHIRLPVLPQSANERPHLQNVPFDHWTGEATYEERRFEDEGLFASFAERVQAFAKDWNYEPLLPQFWREVRRCAQRQPIIGECFAAARRQLERQWGCHNLEVPLSHLCRTESFAWFACHLLSDMARFHATYNDCVREHRRRHRMRSRNHPVPDLIEEDGWLELPFWGWRSGSAGRGRLFARVEGDHVALRVGAETWPSIPAPGKQPAQAISAWRNLEACGFKIRTRALTTTLYARLFLSDLFLHGIGGGKYDELTDAIVTHFYGITPPVYLILSATLFLPLPTAKVSDQDRRTLKQSLRDLHYNPQRHLSGMLGNELVAEKQAWIDRATTTKWERRERFTAIRRISEKLRESVREGETELKRKLDQCEQQLAGNEVLQRRDFSFCLYPVAMLRPFCARFL